MSQKAGYTAREVRQLKYTDVCVVLDSIEVMNPNWVEKGKANRIYFNLCVEPEETRFNPNLKIYDDFFLSIPVSIFEKMSVHYGADTFNNKNLNTCGIDVSFREWASPLDIKSVPDGSKGTDERHLFEGRSIDNVTILGKDGYLLSAYSLSKQERARGLWNITLWIPEDYSESPSGEYWKRLGKIEWEQYYDEAEYLII